MSEACGVGHRRHIVIEGVRYAVEPLFDAVKPLRFARLIECSSDLPVVTFVGVARGGEGLGGRTED